MKTESKKKINDDHRPSLVGVSTTQAAVLTQIGSPLSIMTLSLPPLNPGQVLVQVTYSGLCRTQMMEMQGKKGPDRYLPHTLGHEGSGIVMDVGSAVKKVKPGDHVILSWIKGTGAEVSSTQYQSDMGIIHSGAVSTFMRHTITCENRVTPIPSSMPLREAALLGCAVPTGAGIVFNTAQIQPGSRVAVFGLGGIGLSVLLAASSVKVKSLIAVDIYDHKLEQARLLGATHTFNARSTNVKKEIMDMTDNQGVDYAIEAVGRREAMEDAFHVVRPKGGLCVLAGNVAYGEKMSIDPFDLIKGKRLIGTWGGESVPERDFQQYVERFLNGDFPLMRLITHEQPLEEINRVIEAMEMGQVGRALITMR
ncbi:MAG: zinc-binding dehydrogenase [Nitrospirales bacterium]|nr:zinc-binding dehydrogenase [Nitrospira sp.]MDR4502362.1 zinc-binding dehydrogenase [Nitrospirales bacterium]